MLCLPRNRQNLCRLCNWTMFYLFLDVETSYHLRHSLCVRILEIAKSGREKERQRERERKNGIFIYIYIYIKNTITHRKKWVRYRRNWSNKNIQLHKLSEVIVTRMMYDNIDLCRLRVSTHKLWILTCMYRSNTMVLRALQLIITAKEERTTLLIYGWVKECK